ncbi:hypothetical protein [Priestia megaterium]|uniref:hypothetical protein n=1 Tax=Priestia megaterium TaxID=1404 RepID=UPI0031FBDA74
MSSGYINIDASMNPPTLNKDIDGNYIASQLERIIKTHNLNQKSLTDLKARRKKVLDAIKAKETSSRGNYLRMMKKHDKEKEDFIMLATAIQEIEHMYNRLPKIERRIRDTERRIAAVYPVEFMEVVNTEYEKLKGDN